MLRPKLIEGRWLEPGETGAIVVNRFLRDTERGVKNGATVNLVFNGKTDAGADRRREQTARARSAHL